MSILTADRFAPHPPLPLRVSIARLKHHDDDRLEHQVCIGVVGVTDPLLIADIESDFYERPRIKTYLDDGRQLCLPPRLRDRFVLECYGRIVANLYSAGGVRAWCRNRDARRWLEIRFVTMEAEMLVVALLKHVPRGLVIEHDEHSVEIDP